MVQGLSIKTNVGAMVALEQLSMTNKRLQNTQLRITTGLKVNGPKDDAVLLCRGPRFERLPPALCQAARPARAWRGEGPRLSVHGRVGPGRAGQGYMITHISLN